MWGRKCGGGENVWKKYEREEIKRIQYSGGERYR